MGGLGYPADDYVTEDPLTSEVTHSLVAGRFALSQDYADQTFSTALGYLGSSGAGTSVSFNWPAPSPISLGSPAGISGLVPTTPVSPTITPIAVTPVTFTPTAPVLENYDIIPLGVPEFNVPLPNFFIPAAPSTLPPTFTQSPPAELTITLPSDSEIPLAPPLPVLREILPPDEPVFSLPEFAAIFPTADLTAPDLVYSWNEAAYDTDFNRMLRLKIEDGIINGGKGMLPEVEQAIYDRGRSRLDYDLQGEELLTLNDFSSRGARLPQGALVGRLDEIRFKAKFRVDDLNLDIITKSADLAYQYSTFIIDKGLALEHEYMALFNSVQQRAFEASKVTLEFLIQEYDIQVKAFSARLEGYKTEAEIFKARIQAEIARADLYKATIEGRKLSVEMQSLTVDLYGKQLAAIDTMAKIYLAKMEGQKVISEINGVRVEQFKAYVEAYKAQVEGVTAEYNLYQAKIAGESEKAKMYSYQVEGYGKVVEAYKTRSEIDVSVLDAKVKKSQGEVNIFMAELEKYKADISANVSQAEIQAKAEGLKLQVFDGEIRKFSSIVTALTDSYKAETAVAIANSEIQLRYGDMLARIETAQAEINAELIKAKAQIASQLSAAALSSVSAGANLGYSQSRSDSSGKSKSYGTSVSDQYSSSHSVTERNCCNGE
jgi:hypothetical protein